MKREIQCEECGGKGRTALPQILEETFNALPRKGTAVARDLAAKISGVTSNAMNNRLEKLRSYGFVTRTKEGKFWKYSRA